MSTNDYYQRTSAKTRSLTVVKAVVRVEANDADYHQRRHEIALLKALVQKHPKLAFDAAREALALSK